MILLIPLSFLLAFANFQTHLYKKYPQGTRYSTLAAFILISFFVAVSTELLSSFNQISKTGIATSWLVFNAILVFWYFRNDASDRENLLVVWKRGLDKAWHFFRKTGFLTQFVLSTILFSTLLVALVSPPNNSDSMSYHVSRLVYWLQNGTVEHYSSHIQRSISFSPFSEYVHLHSFVLTGGERFFHLLQWLSLIGILLFVSLFVQLFTKSDNAIRLALCFAVTIPIVVLESMTTQNDLVVSFFVLATAYYAIEYLQTPRKSTILLLSASISLGILTKGIYPFYAAPFGIYLLIKLLSKRNWRGLVGIGFAVVFITLLLNSPFWARNYELTGSPIGTATQGNQNTLHTPKAIISSVSKQVFLHLGFVSPNDRYNNFMLNQLKGFHQFLDFSLDEIGMGMPFKMNKLNFSEDYAHNFIAAWIILAAIVIAFFQRLPKVSRVYFGLSIASFVVFCTFVSYQIFASRLHIPFFVLVAPAIGIIYGSFSLVFQRVLLMVLWLNALPFVILSASHPLLSTKWFFTKVFPVVNQHIKMKVEPEKQANLMQESILFASNNQIMWGDQWPEIATLVSYVDSLNAKNIGYYFEERSYDFAYYYVLRKPGRRFSHVAVANESRIFESPDFKPDCIIAEIDRGQSFIYNQITYEKKWSSRSRSVYLPVNRID